jgi:nucleotide-binding universal stress UspA family protein
MLVAYDGSEPARRALRRAVELSRPGDRVDVVGVLPIDGSARPLDEARAYLDRHGIAGDAIAGGGDPGIAICDVAARHGYDLVFMGSRQLNTLERALLGSVSTWVAHHADCDVVITR